MFPRGMSLLVVFYDIHQPELRADTLVWVIAWSPVSPIIKGCTVKRSVLLLFADLRVVGVFLVEILFWA